MWKPATRARFRRDHQQRNIHDRVYISFPRGGRACPAVGARCAVSGARTRVFCFAFFTYARYTEYSRGVSPLMPRAGTHTRHLRERDRAHFFTHTTVTHGRVSGHAHMSHQRETDREGAPRQHSTLTRPRSVDGCHVHERALGAASAPQSTHGICVCGSVAKQHNQITNASITIVRGHKTQRHTDHSTSHN